MVRAVPNQAPDDSLPIEGIVTRAADAAAERVSKTSTVPVVWLSSTLTPACARSASRDTSKLALHPRPSNLRGTLGDFASVTSTRALRPAARSRLLGRRKS